MNTDKHHTTKLGQQIPLEDLTDSHLDNIIRWIERKAQDGMTVTWAMGGPSYEEMWEDTKDIRGDEVLEHLDYAKYVREKKRRTKL
jgi:hypothetical protein